jgi:hypothetical protein
MIGGRAEMSTTSTNSAAAMYRIRQVDGNEDDIADALAELHQMTFLGAAPFPNLIRGTGGLLFKERSRSPSPVSFRLPTSSMPAIFAALACWVSILDASANCA